MEWLKISTSTEIVRIAVDEIVYILADGNYCDLMLANGSSHKMTFQLHHFVEYFEKLRHNPFTRVGRSMIVNKRHIRVVNIPERVIRFGGHTIDTRIPILRMSKLGRESLQKLKNELNEYADRPENN
ncbi:MAG: LytTR family transcriptional regulator DNA-binding domain-containing protein [Muribaculaceae bacterium]|nr:LytTR family transcriptional regulator DNA-binding domain-containing protein [Muribaculaceae bacterium]MDE5975214.1 LytTR family transcriptional regulator DNA-binding domain-containing protein [Muribaculaceae bacterium]MDE6298710.1 LytTR family transcriptional regulator DNA-binding domain-containing protein [Muribaculaceae bacterium]